MSRKCELTGRGPTTGNLVSHSNIKTRTRWLPNLKRKKFLIDDLGQIVTLRLSARAIKTIDKLGGITPALLNAKEDGLSEQLLAIRNKLLKKKRKASLGSAPKKAS